MTRAETNSQRLGTLCGLLALTGLALTAPTAAWAATSRPGPVAPGSVVVAQGGTIFGGVVKSGDSLEANGEVDVYPPGANGDVAPVARYVHGIHGPSTIGFDPSGDLWAANTVSSNLVEFTKAQLAMPDPSPAVTISSAGQALVNPYSFAFDRGGDIWVVAFTLKRVEEYTTSQLSTSGSPEPHVSISRFPSAPNDDGFDADGDLWVTTVTTAGKDSSCPAGCLVEFSKAELATADPAPTVTISSMSGANFEFTPSGDMWLTTGGGPPNQCFGTPCTNELVEFTGAQLATSGSPSPAVTIKSTRAGNEGSLWGPYSVAVEPSGDAWVSNFNKPTTVEYSRDALSASGSPDPVRTIAGPKTMMNWPSFVVLAP